MRERKDFSQGKAKQFSKPDEKRKRTVADKGNRASRIAGRGGEASGFVPKKENKDDAPKRKYVRKDTDSFEKPAERKAGKDLKSAGKDLQSFSPSKIKRDERSRAYFKKEDDAPLKKNREFKEDEFKPKKTFEVPQEEEKGRESYKKKRSFTKNKTFRENAETAEPLKDFD